MPNFMQKRRLNVSRLPKKLRAAARTGKQRGDRAPGSHLMPCGTSPFIKNQLINTSKCLVDNELSSVDVHNPNFSRFCIFVARLSSRSLSLGAPQTSVTAGLMASRSRK